ncbi:hypothetical protein TNCV_2784321 [Trichonephila clavipes]|nr:hypothetical protein TNCV_2784321 [Trichonephila clavipes]
MFAFGCRVCEKDVSGACRLALRRGVEPAVKSQLRWAAREGRDRRTGSFPSFYHPLRWSGINGVAARAVGFKDLSVTLRSTNGEAATEKGVESVKKVSQRSGWETSLPVRINVRVKYFGVC